MPAKALGKLVGWLRGSAPLEPPFKPAPEMVDGVLSLVLESRNHADTRRGWVPYYRFSMMNNVTHDHMGYIDLRIGDTENIVQYGGHIGYHVFDLFRGNRYAARSLALLLPFAFEHGIDPVILTCNPDNTPSRRSIEIAGGIYLETVPLPRENEMYLIGDREKCRFAFHPPG